MQSAFTRTTWECTRAELFCLMQFPPSYTLHTFCPYSPGSGGDGRSGRAPASGRAAHVVLVPPVGGAEVGQWSAQAGVGRPGYRSRAPHSGRHRARALGWAAATERASRTRQCVWRRKESLERARKQLVVHACVRSDGIAPVVPRRRRARDVGGRGRHGGADDDCRRRPRWMPQRAQVVVLPALEHLHLPGGLDHRADMARNGLHLLPQGARARAQRPQAKGAALPAPEQAGVWGHLRHRGQGLGGRAHLRPDHHWTNSGEYPKKKTAPRYDQGVQRMRKYGWRKFWRWYFMTWSQKSLFKSLFFWQIVASIVPIKMNLISSILALRASKNWRRYSIFKLEPKNSPSESSLSRQHRRN